VSMTDVNVQFGEPQDTSRSGRAPAQEWIKAADMLRENPGQWAQVTIKDKRANAAATAHYVRSAVLRAFEPAGSFDAKAAPALDAEDGEWGVFVRYVGDTEPDPVSKWAEYSVKDLKAHCKDRGLPVGGSKSQLIERLDLDEDDTDDEG